MTPAEIMKSVKKSTAYIYYMFMFSNSGERSVNFYRSLENTLQQQVDLIDRIRILHEQISFYKAGSPNQNLRIRRIQEHYKNFEELKPKYYTTTSIKKTL